MSRRTLTAAQIFAAAEHLVDEHGWSGLTIASLAGELGVRGPSLYSHVANLDDVRAAVQARAMTALSDELRDAAVGRAGADALRAQCDAWRAYALAHPNRYLAMSQAPADPTIFLEASAGADVATRAALRAFELPPEAEDSVQFGLFATVHGFVSLEISDVFTTHLPPGATDTMFQDAVDLVIRGAEGHRPPHRGPELG